MIVFVDIDGESCRGCLILEERLYDFPKVAVPGFYGCLSVKLPKGEYMWVERWEFEGRKVTEEELRAALVPAIRAKLKSRDRAGDGRI
jgi:hypothetical protein